MQDASATDLTLRAQLKQTGRVLRDLHKALVEVETQYFGNVGSPLEHLQLLTNHPHFAWLQKFSSLMAEMDERLDQPEPIDASQAAAFRVALEILVGPRAPLDEALRKQYNALLHDSPDVVMAHGALRRSLEQLPDSKQAK